MKNISIYNEIKQNFESIGKLLDELVDTPQNKEIERKLIYICAPYDEDADFRSQYSQILDYKRMIFCDYDAIPVSLHLYDINIGLKEQIIRLCDEIWIFDIINENMIEEISIADRYKKIIRNATKDGV